MTAADRRDAIVDAAIMEFARSGLEATTTDAIARRAGITQPYVIRLFGTKRDLFLAAVDRVFAEIMSVFADAAASAPPDGRLCALGEAYATILADRNLLLMQLHATAASEDAVIRERVAGHMSALRQQVADDTGATDEELQRFMAMGMLMNAAVALDLPELLGSPSWKTAVVQL